MIIFLKIQNLVCFYIVCFVSLKKKLMKKPQHYYCHRTPTQPSTLPKGYQLIQKIGEGAFGEVFKVFNTQTSAISVMKCTKGEAEDTMNRESQIMSEMSASDGFAKIKEKRTNEDFLIMTLLGSNLQNIIEEKQLNIIDVKRIGYQCLLRLKELHERGYVHRDLKPENVLLGNQNNPHKIYLVDFGLASTFKRHAKHARKMYNGELGTIKFCPVASHNCLEQFPKDDLQSLGYLLVYLMTKELPWSRLPRNLSQQQKFDEIRRIKTQLQIDKFCEGVGCLKKYFKIVRSLQVSQVIDYDSLLQIFYVPCKEDYCYSFCRKECSAKRKVRCEDEGNKENQLQEGSKHEIKMCGFSTSKRQKQIQ